MSGHSDGLIGTVSDFIFVLVLFIDFDVWRCFDQSWFVCEFVEIYPDMAEYGSKTICYANRKQFCFS